MSRSWSKSSGPAGSGASGATFLNSARSNDASGSMGHVSYASSYGSTGTQKGRVTWIKEERRNYLVARGLVFLPGEDVLLNFMEDSLKHAPLPMPWSMHRDKFQRVFFANRSTGETQWTHPLEESMRELAGLVRAILQLKGHVREDVVSNIKGSREQAATQEFAKWYTLREEQSGRDYFCNKETSETMWEHPAEVVLPPYYMMTSAMGKLVDGRYVQGTSRNSNASTPESTKSSGMWAAYRAEQVQQMANQQQQHPQQQYQQHQQQQYQQKEDQHQQQQYQQQVQQQQAAEAAVVSQPSSQTAASQPSLPVGGQLGAHLQLSLTGTMMQTKTLDSNSATSEVLKSFPSTPSYKQHIGFNVDLAVSQGDVNPLYSFSTSSGKHCFFDGVQFAATADTAIFDSLSSYEVIGTLRSGETATASGILQSIDGYEMIPIRPRGAVQRDYVSILAATLQRAKTEEQQNSGGSAVAPSESALAVPIEQSSSLSRPTPTSPKTQPWADFHMLVAQEARRLDETCFGSESVNTPAITQDLGGLTLTTAAAPLSFTQSSADQEELLRQADEEAAEQKRKEIAMEEAENRRLRGEEFDIEGEEAQNAELELRAQEARTQFEQAEERRREAFETRSMHLEELQCLEYVEWENSAKELEPFLEELAQQQEAMEAARRARQHAATVKEHRRRECEEAKRLIEEEEERLRKEEQLRQDEQRRRQERKVRKEEVLRQERVNEEREVKDMEQMDAEGERMREQDRMKRQKEREQREKEEAAARLFEQWWWRAGRKENEAKDKDGSYVSGVEEAMSRFHARLTTPNFGESEAVQKCRELMEEQKRQSADMRRLLTGRNLGL